MSLTLPCQSTGPGRVVTAAATPRLELDVDLALRRYADLSRSLPGTAIHYAVKANPHQALLTRLAGVGARFDVASPAEVTGCLEVGARPSGLIYSNPVKLREDVASAARAGVRLFVVDSPEETAKIAATAPGAQVLCRLVTSGEGSDWPLSRKFGCSTAEAVAILRLASMLGLEPAGVSFHVGSQQRDPHAWRAPIGAAARVFASLDAEGTRPWLLDLGGGFPAAHEGGAPSLREYGVAIDSFLADSFGSRRPQTLAEPGRGIVGDAGVIVSEVVSVLHRGDTRWVYLDCGVFTGLVETLDEAIRYRLSTDVGGPVGPCVLAGPTCDSADVMYERIPVHLPLALAEGDIVRIESAGAYTACYTTVGFNGFAPLPTVLV
jgi:ornithine decarboxylase